jgi:hypothetical protein
MKLEVEVTPVGTKYDVVFFDTIGSAFTRESLKAKASGAAEIAIVKYAHWLAEQGYSVLVLNAVTERTVDEGVEYDGSGRVIDGLECRALVISRYSVLPAGLIKAEKTIVWSVDASPESHNHQRSLLESGEAELVCISPWHASLFPRHWPIRVIPSALPDSIYGVDEQHEHTRNPNAFVYCSAWLKGGAATVAKWGELKVRYPELAEARLYITSPGYDEPDMELIARTPGVAYLGKLPADEVETLLRKSAGLFYVNTFAETFCLAAVLAEAVGCRTHILLAGDPAAIPWTVRSPLVTKDAAKFESDFVTLFPESQREYLEARAGSSMHPTPNDFSMSNVMPQWLNALNLGSPVKHYISPINETVCLTMIVSEKTSVETLESCIDSVRGYIDCVCLVVDPGSKWIRHEWDAHLRVHIHEEPWLNFGHNRTKAIEHARGLADYDLMIDADDVLEFEPWFEMPELRHDHYDIVVRDGNLVYWRPHLFRNDSDYWFKGAMHEHLDKKTPHGLAPRLFGVSYIRQAAGTDAKRHEAAIAALAPDTRSLFYHAQELKDSGRTREALQAYELRASMHGGSIDEVFYSLLQVARCHWILGSPATVVETAYVLAYEERPDRAPEPMRELAEYYRTFPKKVGVQKAYHWAKKGYGVPFPGQDTLFVDRSAYEWRIQDELGIACYYLGKYTEGREVYEKLFEDGTAPADALAHLEENLNFHRVALGLPPRTEHQPLKIVRVVDMERARAFGEFAQRLTRLELPDSASPHWRSRCEEMVVSATTKPLEDFLVWSNDVSIYEYNDSFKSWHAELQADPQWPRWQKLSRKSREKDHALSVDAGATPITVQHAYHLKKFEEWTESLETAAGLLETGNKFWEDVDLIVEVGGGYGNFARMLRLDGYEGEHVIIDLPHVREIQRLFGRLIGDNSGHVELWTEEDLDHAIEIGHPIFRQDRIAFVATWSLSETPLSFREKLFPALHQRCTKYLVASQWTYDWTGSDPEQQKYDNQKYFEQFMKDAGGTWVVRPVPHHETESYLFGVK